MPHDHDGVDFEAKHRELKGRTSAVALRVRGIDGDERGNVPHHEEFTRACIKDRLWGRARIGARHDHRARLLALSCELFISHALIVVVTGAKALVSRT
jgi:hypothetical protein